MDKGDETVLTFSGQGRRQKILQFCAGVFYGKFFYAVSIGVGDPMFWGMKLFAQI